MNTHTIKGATTNGAARFREMSGGLTLINIPDRETTIIMANASKILDLSSCKRMSRGAANRIVDSMTDATDAVKTQYHRLINAAKEEGVAE